MVDLKNIFFELVNLFYDDYEEENILGISGATDQDNSMGIYNFLYKGDSVNEYKDASVMYKKMFPSSDEKAFKESLIDYIYRDLVESEYEKNLNMDYEKPIEKSDDLYQKGYKGYLFDMLDLDPKNISNFSDGVGNKEKYENSNSKNESDILKTIYNNIFDGGQNNFYRGDSDFQKNSDVNSIMNFVNSFDFGDEKKSANMANEVKKNIFDIDGNLLGSSKYENSNINSNGNGNSKSDKKIDLMDMLFGKDDYKESGSYTQNNKVSENPLNSKNYDSEKNLFFENFFGEDKEVSTESTPKKNTFFMNISDDFFGLGNDDYNRDYGVDSQDHSRYFSNKMSKSESENINSFMGNGRNENINSIMNEGSNNNFLLDTFRDNGDILLNKIYQVLASENGLNGSFGSGSSGENISINVNNSGGNNQDIYSIMEKIETQLRQSMMGGSSNSWSSK